MNQLRHEALLAKVESKSGLNLERRKHSDVNLRVEREEGLLCIEEVQVVQHF